MIVHRKGTRADKNFILHMRQISLKRGYLYSTTVHSNVEDKNSAGNENREETNKLITQM